MGPPTVILSARSPRWTARLGRALRAHGLPLRRVGRAEDCVNVLAEAPGSVVVLELDAAAESWPSSVELIARLKRADRECAVVVIVPAAVEFCELAVREAGAVHVCNTEGPGDSVVEIVRRHIERRSQNV